MYIIRRHGRMRNWLYLPSIQYGKIIKNGTKEFEVKTVSLIKNPS